MTRRKQRITDRRQEWSQNAALKQLNEGKLGKMTFQEKRAHLLRQLEEQKRKKKASEGEQDAANDEDWEDVDEHEKEVYATTGFFDCPDTEA